MKKYFLIFVLLFTSFAQASTWFYYDIDEGPQKDAQGNEYRVKAKRFSDGTFKMQIMRTERDHFETRQVSTTLDTVYANEEEFEKALQAGSVSDGKTSYSFKPKDVKQVRDKLDYTKSDVRKENIRNYESDKAKIIADYKTKIEGDSTLSQEEKDKRIKEFKQYMDGLHGSKLPEGATVDKKALDERDKSLDARGYFEATSQPVTALFQDFTCFWVNEAGAPTKANVLETDSCGMSQNQKLCVGTIKCTGNKVWGWKYKNYMPMMNESSRVSGQTMAKHVRDQLLATDSKKGGLKDDPGKYLYFQTESGGVACKADPKTGCNDASACLTATGAINLKKDTVKDFNQKIQNGTLNMNKDKGVQ